MSKAQWPKIRARKYRWQDKNKTMHEGANFQINCHLLDGTRYQRSFKDRKDAESDAARLRNERMVELKNRTVSLNHLSDEERIDVLESRRILDGKVTLQQSAVFYLEHNILSTGPVLTVNEALERYLAASRGDGLRERSMRDLQGRLQKLARTFGIKTVTSISRSDADAWLQGLKKENGEKYSLVSKRHFEVVAGGLFNGLLAKEYVKLNPFATLWGDAHRRPSCRSICACPASAPVVCSRYTE